MRKKWLGLALFHRPFDPSINPVELNLRVMHESWTGGGVKGQKTKELNSKKARESESKVQYVQKAATKTKRRSRKKKEFRKCFKGWTENLWLFALAAVSRTNADMANRHKQYAQKVCVAKFYDFKVAKEQSGIAWNDGQAENGQFSML